MFIFTTFAGNEDHSAGWLYRCYSSDAGKSLSEPELFMEPPEGAINLMGISLLRLMDERIGAAYCLLEVDQPRSLRSLLMASSDEGETWSEGVAICKDKVYIVVNNDRLVQMRDGTLPLPYALHGDWNREVPYDWKPCRRHGIPGCMCMLRSLRLTRTATKLTYMPPWKRSGN